MYAMTGLDVYDWLMVAIGLVGAWLVWWAFRSGPGTRRMGARIIPLLGGLIVLGLALRLQPSRTLDALRSLATTPKAGLVFVVVVIVVIALMVLVFVQIFDWYLEQSELHTAWPITLASNVFLGVSTVLIVSISVGAVAVGDNANVARMSGVEVAVTGPFVVGWNVGLPGPPLDMTYHETSNSLYVTLGTGEIVRIEPADDVRGTPSQPVVVATGLSYPRGIAAIGDRFFVGELYNMPCPPSSAHCRGDDVVDAATRTDGEVKILQEGRGRIVEFSLESDGTLARRGVLVDDLPVANTDHAINALISDGPDSLILSIGHIDHLRWSIDEYEAITHPNKHLLGTVIRIDVDTGESEIIADGIRNVFGTTIDPLGVVWGTDNDGPALNGHRREEVLRIRDGAHFGFPIDGSAPPYVERTDPASFTLPIGTNGSGGLQWVDGVDNGQGMLVGSLGKISFLGLADTDGVFRVPDTEAYWDATPASGYVIAIESIGPRAVVFAEWGPNRLHLLWWGDGSATE